VNRNTHEENFLQPITVTCAMHMTIMSTLNLPYIIPEILFRKGAGSHVNTWWRYALHNDDDNAK